MTDDGQLKVDTRDGRMVVELSENILFDSGKDDLKAEGKTALTEVATVLASIQNRDFQIAGHTDNMPIKSARFPSNWELSTARAVAVTRFLAANGVPERACSAAGYAEHAAGRVERHAGRPRAEPPHRDRADAEPRRAAEPRRPDEVATRFAAAAGTRRCRPAR